MKNILTLLLTCFLAISSFAQSDGEKLVYHLQVLDDIDPRTNRYTELGLEAADEIETA